MPYKRKYPASSYHDGDSSYKVNTPYSRGSEFDSHRHDSWKRRASSSRYRDY